MPERCLWTNRRDDRVVPGTVDAPALFGGPARPTTVHVLPEHEAELRAFNDLVARYGRFLLISVAVYTALVLLLAVADAVLELPGRAVASGIGSLTVGLGALIIALPFSTPQTAQAFGLRTSIRIARWSGVVTVVVGVWIALLG